MIELSPTYQSLLTTDFQEDADDECLSILKVIDQNKCDHLAQVLIEQNSSLLRIPSTGETEKTDR